MALILLLTCRNQPFRAKTVAPNAIAMQRSEPEARTPQLFFAPPGKVLQNVRCLTAADTSFTLLIGDFCAPGCRLVRGKRDLPCKTVAEPDRAWVVWKIQCSRSCNYFICRVITNCPKRRQDRNCSNKNCLDKSFVTYSPSMNGYGQ